MHRVAASVGGVVLALAAACGPGQTTPPAPVSISTTDSPATSAASTIDPDVAVPTPAGAATSGSGGSVASTTSTTSTAAGTTNVVVGRCTFGDHVSFTSPSGRFTCGIMSTYGGAERGAGCHGDTVNPPRPVTCDSHIHWGDGMQVGRGGAVSFLCTGGLIYGDSGSASAPALPYGSTVTAYGFSCTSASDGVSCLEVASGHGFRIAAESNDEF